MDGIGHRLSEEIAEVRELRTVRRSRHSGLERRAARDWAAWSKAVEKTVFYIRHCGTWGRVEGQRSHAAHLLRDGQVGLTSTCECHSAHGARRRPHAHVHVLPRAVGDYGAWGGARETLREHLYLHVNLCQALVPEELPRPILLLLKAAYIVVGLESLLPGRTVLGVRRHTHNSGDAVERVEGEHAGNRDRVEG